LEVDAGCEDVEAPHVVVDPVFAAAFGFDLVDEFFDLVFVSLG